MSEADLSSLTASGNSRSSDTQNPQNAKTSDSMRESQTDLTTLQKDDGLIGASRQAEREDERPHATTEKTDGHASGDLEHLRRDTNPIDIDRNECGYRTVCAAPWYEKEVYQSVFVHPRW